MSYFEDYFQHTKSKICHNTAGFFVHTSLLAAVTVTNTGQHNTNRNNMSSSFWGARKTERHTRRTQVTLHYCSLLFHCLISQRLINMHASPGCQGEHSYIKCRYNVMLLGYIWKQCAAKKGQREGHVPEG